MFNKGFDELKGEYSSLSKYLLLFFYLIARFGPRRYLSFVLKVLMNSNVLQTESDVVLLTWHDMRNGRATSSFNRWLSQYHTRDKNRKKKNVLYEYFDKCYQLLITNMWIFGRLKHQMSLPGCIYIRLGWMVQKERMILLGLSNTVNLFNVFSWVLDI